MATLVGGALAVGLGAVALAAPPPPDPGPSASTTSAPEGVVEAGDRPDAGQATPWKDPAATPGVGKVAVVKWVEGVPTAWPVTVTILDAGATFADGSTTVDVVTDPNGEPVELSLVGVPTGGVRVRLQEPDRSDATFQDVVCESYGNRYETVEIERGVELIVPPLAGGAGGEGWGHWRPFPVCWFENVASTRVTLASTLDGGAPAGGTAMAVVPETGRVGVGGTFDDDGIFPVGADPVDVELSGFPAGGPMDVFVGQLTTSGSTISGMRCTVGVSTFTGPLEAREIGGATVVIARTWMLLVCVRKTWRDFVQKLSCMSVAG